MDRGHGVRTQFRGTIQETTVLFRAVTGGELASITALGAFTNPRGIEVKYFSTTLKGARSYAEQAASAFGEGPFTMVKTSIPLRLITAIMRVTVDRGIDTVIVPTVLLSRLADPEILVEGS